MKEFKYITKIEPPLTNDVIEMLRSGDEINLCGDIYVARDAVHRIFFDLLINGKQLPIDIKGQIIYYMGPSPTPPNKIIGSCGPTTSCRMDAYTPKLLDLGLKATIGKGKRSNDVKVSMIKNKAIYLAAVGGTGALLSKYIKKVETIAYDYLGPESLLKIKVEDFPVIVVNDIYGGDIYLDNRKKFQF